MAKKRNYPNTKSGVVGVVDLPGNRQAEIIREGDPDGRPVAHARTIDTLGKMLRAGTITSAMHEAAQDFQTKFTIAAFESIRAVSLERLSGHTGGGSDVADHQLSARRNVFDALGAMGGIGSPAGSCIWFVVGLQNSIQQWATRQGWGGRSVRNESARGILIAGLGMLAAHYGYDQKNYRLGA